MRIDRLIEIFGECPAGLTKMYLRKYYENENLNDVSTVLCKLYNQGWIGRITVSQFKRTFYYYWLIA